MAGWLAGLFLSLHFSFSVLHKYLTFDESRWAGDVLAVMTPILSRGLNSQKCQVHRRSGLVDIALRLRKSTASFRMHSMDSRCGVHMPNTPNEKTKSPETPEVKIVMKMEKETKTQLKVPEPHMWVSLWALCGFNEPANLSAIKDSL